MIVYSVSILDLETGVETIVGPWAAEWMADSYAETASVNCKRTVIRWQMLNATDKTEYSPAQVQSKESSE